MFGKSVGWCVLLFYTMWDVALMNPKCLSPPGIYELPTQTGYPTIPCSSPQRTVHVPPLRLSVGLSLPRPPDALLSLDCYPTPQSQSQCLSPSPLPPLLPASHASSGFPSTPLRRCPPPFAFPAAAAGPLLPALRRPDPSWSRGRPRSLPPLDARAVTLQRRRLLVGPEAGPS